MRHLFVRTYYRVTSLLKNGHISGVFTLNSRDVAYTPAGAFRPSMTPTLWIVWNYLWTIFYCLVLLCGPCRSSKGSKLVFVSVVSCLVASAMSERDRRQYRLSTVSELKRRIPLRFSIPPAMKCFWNVVYTESCPMCLLSTH